MTSFKDLGLVAPILSALEAEGYTTPTPIQAQAIPHVLAGRDLQGIAQTGTGKTAAFALPILQLLAGNQARRPPGAPAACWCCRRPANWPARSPRTSCSYGRNLGLRTALMFGGVPKGRQSRLLANGVDVLVATPGRLLDHLADGAVRLDQVEILVLDEADHMLDLGFIVPIRRIAAQIPAQAAEPVLLGHHAEGNRAARRRAC